MDPRKRKSLDRLASHEHHLHSSTIAMLDAIRVYEFQARTGDTHEMDSVRMSMSRTVNAYVRDVYNHVVAMHCNLDDMGVVHGDNTHRAKILRSASTATGPFKPVFPSTSPKSEAEMAQKWGAMKLPRTEGTCDVAFYYPAVEIEPESTKPKLVSSVLTSSDGCRSLACSRDAGNNNADKDDNEN